MGAIHSFWPSSYIGNDFWKILMAGLEGLIVYYLFTVGLCCGQRTWPAWFLVFGTYCSSLYRLIEDQFLLIFCWCFKSILMSLSRAQGSLVIKSTYFSYSTYFFVFILQLDVLNTGQSTLKALWLDVLHCSRYFLLSVCVWCYLACWITQDLRARNPTHANPKPTKGNALIGSASLFWVLPLLL